MIEPTEEQKRQYLRDGALGAIAEFKRREPELKELRDCAQAVFLGLLHTPTWEIATTPLPEGTPEPVEALWSVRPKVTTL